MPPLPRATRAPGRLLVDVTDLVHWPRRLTGIQRVIRDLAVTGGDDVGTCYYADSHGVPLVLDRDEVLARRARVDALPGGPDEESVRHGLIRPLRGAGETLVPRPGDAVLAVSMHVMGDGMRSWYASQPAAGSAPAGAAGLPDLLHFVHDVLPLTHPHLFDTGASAPFRRYLRSVVTLSDAVLTSTAHTARQIREQAVECGLPAPEVTATGLASDRVAAAPSQRLVPDRPFVLMVGTIEGRKNHRLAYEAYRLAHERGVELPTLVVAGQPGWLAGDVLHLMTTDPATRDRITVLTDVRDEDLAGLYDACLFTLYPSIVEGWGLPVGESAAHGKVCVTGASPSMDDVAMDVMPRVDSWDPAGLLEWLVKLSDADVRLQYEEALRAARGPSWGDVWARIGVARDAVVTRRAAA